MARTALKVKQSKKQKFSTREYGRQIGHTKLAQTSAQLAKTGSYTVNNHYITHIRCLHNFKIFCFLQVALFTKDTTWV